ncbi:uncharacterized [Tachysurus ichikawai]
MLCCCHGWKEQRKKELLLHIKEKNEGVRDTITHSVSASSQSGFSAELGSLKADSFSRALVDEKVAEERRSGEVEEGCN